MARTPARAEFKAAEPPVAAEVAAETAAPTGPVDPYAGIGTYSLDSFVDSKSSTANLSPTVRAVAEGIITDPKGMVISTDGWDEKTLKNFLRHLRTAIGADRRLSSRIGSVDGAPALRLTAAPKPEPKPAATPAALPAAQ